MGPMMPGNIPFHAVTHWCEFHDYPGDAVHYLDACFAEMDSVFMKNHTLRMNRK